MGALAPHFFRQPSVLPFRIPENFGGTFFYSDFEHEPDDEPFVPIGGVWGVAAGVYSGDCVGNIQRFSSLDLSNIYSYTRTVAEFIAGYGAATALGIRVWLDAANNVWVFIYNADSTWAPNQCLVLENFGGALTSIVTPTGLVIGYGVQYTLEIVIDNVNTRVWLNGVLIATLAKAGVVRYANFHLAMDASHTHFHELHVRKHA